MTLFVFVLLFCVVRIMFLDTFLVTLSAALLLHSKVNMNCVWQRLLLVVAGYYVCFSSLEFFLHKFVMHEWKWMGVAPGHLRHHLNVNDDMSLRKPDSAHDDEFNWIPIGLTAFGLSVLMWPVMRSMRVGARTHCAICVAYAVGVGFAWNNIHNAMHDDEKHIPLSFGPPRLCKNTTIRGWPFFKPLLKHHRLHHIIKTRKTNYCIVLLGADRLFGYAPTDTEVREANERVAQPTRPARKKTCVFEQKEGNGARVGGDGDAVPPKE